MTAMRMAWVLALVACSSHNTEVSASWPSGPFVRVTIREPHATPLQLEVTVARPLENVIGARTRTSIRAETVTIDVATRDVERVRNAITRHRAELPPDADPPVVLLEQPVELAYAVRSDKDTIDALTAKHKAIVTRLEQLAGVSSVEVCGEHELVRVVETDPARLKMFGVTLHDVQVAIEKMPTHDQVGDGSGPAELMDVVIATRATIPVYIHDVARVSVEPRAMGCSAYVNEQRIIVGKIRGSANLRDLNKVVNESGLEAVVFPSTALREDGDRWTILAPDAQYVVGIVGSNRTELEMAAHDIEKALGPRAAGTLGVDHVKNDDIVIAAEPTTLLHVDNAVGSGPGLAREIRRVDREPWAGVLISWSSDGVQGIAEKINKVKLPNGIRWRIEKR